MCLQPILCETLITVVEYTKTVMFMWMFIEGMYLHFMLVVSVFSTSKPNYPLFYLLGWGEYLRSEYLQLQRKDEVTASASVFGFYSHPRQF